MGLYSKRLQKMSKRVKNISDTLGFALSASFLFSPHFGIICDLLLTDWIRLWVGVYMKVTNKIMIELNHHKQQPLEKSKK